MDMDQRMGELLVEGRISSNDVRRLVELDRGTREWVLRLIGPERGTPESDTALMGVLANAISGQIAGVHYRGLTPGSGSSARY